MITQPTMSTNRDQVQEEALKVLLDNNRYFGYINGCW